MRTLILFSILLFGCSKKTELDFGPDSVMTLARGPCYGPCPTYLLTVKGNGDVSFSGTENVKVTGLSTSVLSSGKIEELYAAFRAAGYLSLTDYIKEEVSDSPTVVTSVKTTTQDKKVVHYHGDLSAPESLRVLEEKIDQIVGTDKWIK